MAEICILVAVAGHLGMWTVSRDKEGEAEFDALQQLQHAAAHEAFSSLLPTRGETVASSAADSSQTSVWLQLIP